MDNVKMGALIKKLRTEKGMTQLMLAQLVGVSDRAVSKWERGLGGPDLSIIAKLSEALGTGIEKLLEGEQPRNPKSAGNPRRTKFFVCPHCGSFTASMGEPEIFCCGKRLLPCRPADDHRLTAEKTDGGFFVKADHPMEKDHYITALVRISFDRVDTVKLYPEQEAEACFPDTRGGRFYAICSRHGIFSV